MENLIVLKKKKISLGDKNSILKYLLREIAQSDTSNRVVVFTLLLILRMELKRCCTEQRHLKLIPNEELEQKPLVILRSEPLWFEEGLFI